MARMLSHLHSNILGSVGGITYMNNPFHQIVARQRTVPVQPNTNNQVFAKNAFGAAVAAWEAAGDVFRQGWADFAATVTYTGPFGDYHPTGRMLAIAQYQIVSYMYSRAFGGFLGALSMQPPVVPGLLIVQDPKINVGPGGQTGFSVETTNNNGEPVVFYCERSFQQSNARNFYKGPFLSSTLDVVSIADTQDGDIDYTGLNDQSIYFVKGRFISGAAPFRFSQQFILRALAQTQI